jgi:hypothetical protein
MAHFDGAHHSVVGQRRRGLFRRLIAA